MRGKKLRGNGRWESSRMILPEQRQAIRGYHKDQNRKTPKELGLDAIEEIERVIAQAWETRQPVTITVFGEFSDRDVVGTIERIDPIMQRLRLGEEYVRFSDILKVELRSHNK